MRPTLRRITPAALSLMFVLVVFSSIPIPPWFPAVQDSFLYTENQE